MQIKIIILLQIPSRRDNFICAEHEECFIEKATAEKAANPGRCRERRERVWPGSTDKLAHGIVEPTGRWQIKT